MEKWIPKGSFIAADDFKSPAELAKYLVEVSKSKEKYLKYGL